MGPKNKEVTSPSPEPEKTVDTGDLMLCKLKESEKEAVSQEAKKELEKCHKEQIEEFDMYITDNMWREPEKIRKIYDQFEKVLKSRYSNEFLAREFYTKIGSAYSSRGKRKEAIVEFKKAIVLLEKIYHQSEDPYSLRFNLNGQYNRIQEDLVKEQRYAEALGYIDKNIVILEEGEKRMQDHKWDYRKKYRVGKYYWGWLGSFYSDKTYVLVKLGKPEEAKIYREKYLERFRERQTFDEYIKNRDDRLEYYKK